MPMNNNNVNSTGYYTSPTGSYTTSSPTQQQSSQVLQHQQQQSGSPQHPQNHDAGNQSQQPQHQQGGTQGYQPMQHAPAHTQQQPQYTPMFSHGQGGLTILNAGPNSFSSWQPLQGQQSTPNDQQQQHHNPPQHQQQGQQGPVQGQQHQVSQQQDGLPSFTTSTTLPPLSTIQPQQTQQQPLNFAFSAQGGLSTYFPPIVPSPSNGWVPQQQQPQQQQQQVAQQNQNQQFQPHPAFYPQNTATAAGQQNSFYLPSNTVNFGLTALLDPSQQNAASAQTATFYATGAQPQQVFYAPQPQPLQIQQQSNQNQQHMQQQPYPTPTLSHPQAGLPGFAGLGNTVGVEAPTYMSTTSAGNQVASSNGAHTPTATNAVLTPAHTPNGPNTGHPSTTPTNNGAPSKGRRRTKKASIASSTTTAGGSGLSAVSNGLDMVPSQQHDMASPPSTPPLNNNGGLYYAQQGNMVVPSHGNSTSHGTNNVVDLASLTPPSLSAPELHHHPHQQQSETYDNQQQQESNSSNGESAEAFVDPTPRLQNLRFPKDAYTPKWVRFQGAAKEGFCDMCPTPGRWLQLKNSAYWYHKQFSHGISSISGLPFTPPAETRVVFIATPQTASPTVKPVTDNFHPPSLQLDGTHGVINLNSHHQQQQQQQQQQPASQSTPPSAPRFTVSITLEGLCHQCNKWHPLINAKRRGYFPLTMLARYTSYIPTEGRSVPSPFPSFMTVLPTNQQDMDHCNSKTVPPTLPEGSIKVLAATSPAHGGEYLLPSGTDIIPRFISLEIKEVMKKQGMTMLWFRHAFKCHIYSPAPIISTDVKSGGGMMEHHQGMGEPLKFESGEGQGVVYEEKPKRGRKKKAASDDGAAEGEDGVVVAKKPGKRGPKPKKLKMEAADPTTSAGLMDVSMSSNIVSIMPSEFPSASSNYASTNQTPIASTPPEPPLSATSTNSPFSPVQETLNTLATSTSTIANPAQTIMPTPQDTPKFAENQLLNDSTGLNALTQAAENSLRERTKSLSPLPHLAIQNEESV
ncbi:hypothetical protein HDV05_006565 [Chytridiales sp. JEL 0842]|nr:hypothetical protein HDV05_006565 [Chytridiales sp. JEL 0842]